jgi:hypothetical protein
MSRRTRQRAAGAHVALTAAYAAMLLTGTSLPTLAQAVLGGDDTAAALDHLTGTWAAGPSCWNMRAANGSR